MLVRIYYMEENNASGSNFGFKKVATGEKQGLVNQVFSSVARNYDLMNDIMSLGMHRLWKRQFCSQVKNLDSSMLDMAGGTGDVAFMIKARARQQNKNPHIILCDINSEMLKVAKERSINKNLFQNLSFVTANAEALPFPDNSFDYYTIAFGIRNVPRIEMALQEAYRVLKPMGKLLCLEFSKMPSETLDRLYQFYSFKLIPEIGGVVAGNKGAYEYLVESIKLFPSQDDFKVMISEIGFKNVAYQNLTFGIAAIHSGYKL